MKTWCTCMKKKITCTKVSCYCTKRKITCMIVSCNCINRKFTCTISSRETAVYKIISTWYWPQEAKEVRSEKKNNAKERFFVLFAVIQPLFHSFSMGMFVSKRILKNLISLFKKGFCLLFFLQSKINRPQIG